MHAGSKIGPAQPPRAMPSQWQHHSFSSAAQSASVGATAQDLRAEGQGEQRDSPFNRALNGGSGKQREPFNFENPAVPTMPDTIV